MRYEIKFYTTDGDLIKGFLENNKKSIFKLFNDISKHDTKNIEDFLELNLDIRIKDMILYDNKNQKELKYYLFKN